jgi:rare lipoprotein A
MKAQKHGSVEDRKQIGNLASSLLDYVTSRLYRFQPIGICSLLLLVLVVSCAPVRRPPPHLPPPVETSTKKVPDIEPLEGKPQRVIASWYGAEYHGRPTASGEPFNMYALTCAHREFPFGTMLRVSNPTNQRTVECTVNDRGPFVAGRDLDLSYAAAKRIEIIGSGVASVDIEPFARDMRYVKAVRGKIISGVMTIQIGSFREESNAIRLKAALELRYRDVYITTAMIDGFRHYRVRLGKFTDPKEVNSLANTLAQEGYDTFITRYE